MLIKFNDILSKYGKPKGIIHIGAHLAEERDDYILNGLNNTIWIEANLSVFNRLDFLKNSKTEKGYNYAISNIDNKIVSLNITNNGQSSSILELEKHKIHHPNIYVTETVQVMSKRMDSLIIENNIDMNLYDFINIDIQGAELLAIEGFGDYLNYVNYIYTEVNTAYLYKNCSLLDEIDTYLMRYNFIRVENKMTKFEWGDALYIKNHLNS